MADYTEPVQLDDHKLGDRWVGATIGPVTINGSTPSNPLTRVRMQFRLGTSVYTLDSDSSQTRDAAITIDDADTWEASIAELDTFLATPGRWSWDMEFYVAAYSSPLTLFKGSILVHDQVTE